MDSRHRVGHRANSARGLRSVSARPSIAAQRSLDDDSLETRSGRGMGSCNMGLYMRKSDENGRAGRHARLSRSSRPRIEPDHTRSKLAAEPADTRLRVGRPVKLLDMPAARRQDNVLGQARDSGEQIVRERLHHRRLEERNIVSSWRRVKVWPRWSVDDVVFKHLVAILARRTAAQRDLRRSRVSASVRVRLR